MEIHFCVISFAQAYFVSSSLPKMADNLCYLLQVPGLYLCISSFFGRYHVCCELTVAGIMPLLVYTAGEPLLRAMCIIWQDSGSPSFYLHQKITARQAFWYSRVIVDAVFLYSFFCSDFFCQFIPTETLYHWGGWVNFTSNIWCRKLYIL